MNTCQAAVFEAHDEFTMHELGGCMNQASVYEVLQPDRFKAWLKEAFTEVGITSVELLKNDKKLEKAVLIVYKRIPLLPFRAAIKATIGQDGFTKLVFRVRDGMRIKVDGSLLAERRIPQSPH